MPPNGPDVTNKHEGAGVTWAGRRCLYTGEVCLWAERRRPVSRWAALVMAWKWAWAIPVGRRTGAPTAATEDLRHTLQSLKDELDVLRHR
jgi:hypothetical protein